MMVSITPINAGRLKQIVVQEVVVLETKQVKAATADILKQHSIPDWLSQGFTCLLGHTTPEKDCTDVGGGFHRLGHI